jgi:hypothetical protein
MKKTTALGTLRAVRNGSIPIEKLDEVIEWLERRKWPGRKEDTLEQKIQKLVKLRRFAELLWAEIEARKSHRYKPAIYDLAVKAVAKDMKIKAKSLSSFKKDLPEYLFYLPKPIENVPSHMRPHVLEARKDLAKMPRRFRRFEYFLPRILELEHGLRQQTTLRK